MHRVQVGGDSNRTQYETDSNHHAKALRRNMVLHHFGVLEVTPIPRQIRDHPADPECGEVQADQYPPRPSDGRVSDPIHVVQGKCREPYAVENAERRERMSEELRGNPYCKTCY